MVLKLNANFCSNEKQVFVVLVIPPTLLRCEPNAVALLWPCGVAITSCAVRR